jgi:hypothetical protein
MGNLMSIIILNIVRMFITIQHDKILKMKLQSAYCTSGEILEDTNAFYNK